MVRKIESLPQQRLYSEKELKAITDLMQGGGEGYSRDTKEL